MKKIYFLLLIGIMMSFTACKTAPKKADPNFLGDFDGQELGTMMAGTVKRLKNEIKPAEFKFTFYPRTNRIVFHHKYLIDNIWITLTQENREILIEAIHKYFEEFKNKNLTVKDNKKKAYFGKTKVNLSWGIFGATREATPTLRCEYQLLTNNRPYFILGNATTKANKSDANCPALRMAFSPAQCEDLLEVLSQENLNKLVENLNKDFEKYDLSNNTNSEEKTKEDKQINYDENF